ncbi:MAG TPA: alpha/beta fold hydrolase [Isosphaeraceae bacterium]|jgi:alpha-beta hydrolase superfamily lysophospholipase|nr:alpha/beta fold hydrolase [Isosphaeraceae bacterium]
MIEPRFQTQTASDGYPIHVTIWAPAEPMRGRIVVLHGVQSHGGWYLGLGRRLAEAGFEASFPDRRGSGANRAERGHTPSPKRLLDDLGEWLADRRAQRPAVPVAVAGISWGGKLALVAAGRFPDRVDALALICPGLHPRVGVTTAERLQIALAWFTNRRKTFPIPLSDPALFTASREGQAFIAGDHLSLRAGTAGLMAASAWIDRWVKRIPPRVHQPVLLMLAGHDRIVDNERTRAYIELLASQQRTIIEYPEAHHTLEFEPRPAKYARDLAEWLDGAFAERGEASRV